MEHSGTGNRIPYNFLHLVDHDSMVSMFSHWTEAFPYRQATASSVAKVLLEKIIPVWGAHLKLHKD